MTRNHHGLVFYGTETILKLQKYRLIAINREQEYQLIEYHHRWKIYHVLSGRKKHSIIWSNRCISYNETSSITKNYVVMYQRREMKRNSNLLSLLDKCEYIQRITTPDSSNQKHYIEIPHGYINEAARRFIDGNKVTLQFCSYDIIHHIKVHLMV